MKHLYILLLSAVFLIGATSDKKPSLNNDQEIKQLRQYINQLHDEIEIAKKSNNVIPLGDPLKGFKVSSHFNLRRFHPILKKFKPHLGIDLSAKQGNEVYATGNGIAKVDTSKSYGLIIEISHVEGSYDSYYKTRYAHLSQILIQNGDTVKKGDVIGAVGSTGRSTGPHLHYEVERYGEKIDPLILMNVRI